MRKVFLFAVFGIFLMSFVSADYTAPSYSNVTLVLESSYTAPSYSNVTLVLGVGEAPPEDTCTCAGFDTNWEVDMSDFCELNSPCELGTGMLNFTGTGYANCSANINTTNLGDPGTGGILYISSDCLIYVR